MRNFLLILTLSVLPISIYSQSGSKKGSFDAAKFDELDWRIGAGMKISVQGSSNTQNITYTYNFDGNREAYEHYFENFEPVLESNGGRALIKVEFPKNTNRKVNYRVEKHELIITMPSEVMLRMMTRYSNVEISSLNRGVEVNNRSGQVKVEDVNQNVTVNNPYGRVLVTNVKGDVLISNRSANIDVREIIGRVKLDVSYSKINVSKINGELDISNRSANVNAFDIQGKLTAKGPYVNYELTNIEGGITMENRSASVDVSGTPHLLVKGGYVNINALNITGDDGVSIEGRSASVGLKDVRKSVVVTGSYINIDLENIGGNVNIENRSGKIEIDGLENSLNVSGQYLPIEVMNFNGPSVQINNRSGSIEIESTSQIRHVDIKSEHGDVGLELKQSFSGIIDLELRYGDIETNLNLSDRNSIKEGNQQSLTGIAGNKRDSKIRIRNRSGNITVKQL